MIMNSSTMFYGLSIVIVVTIVALLYATNLYVSVKREDSGNKRMIALSSYIHEGAMAFLKREYKIIILFILIVAFLLFSLGFIPSLQGIDGVGINGAICFVIGSLFSGLAGFIGMKAATAANAKVAQAARDG